MLTVLTEMFSTLTPSVQKLTLLDIPASNCIQRRPMSALHAYIFIFGVYICKVYVTVKMIYRDRE